MTLIVSKVEFRDTGITFEYVDSVDDARDNGMVLNHTMFVPATKHFGKELDDFHTHTTRFLATALLAFAGAQPIALHAVEDEPPSPYDNPADGGTP